MEIMRTTALVSRALCVSAMTVALISAAQATATRTYVNATTGADSNTASNCVATTPCKTFAAAYTVTQSGGEIVATVPGGYGPITITTPLTILGTDGATVTAPSGGTAITISAGSTDKVYIRNLQITGANAANSTGIALNSGLLSLRDSAVKLTTTGLIVTNTHADVINSDFVGNGTAILTNGPGLNFGGNQPYPPATTLVRLNRGNFIENTVAFTMNNVGTNTGGSNNRISVVCFGTGSNALTSTEGNGTLTLLTGSPTALTFNACILTYGFGGDFN
jgi:hypothetical protein